MDGVDNWYFNVIIGSAPVILGLALFLLISALTDYLYFVNKVIGGVFAGFIGFPLAFYPLITSTADISYEGPFQTPISRIIRFLFSQDQRYPEQIGKEFRFTFFQKKKRSSPRSGGLGGPNTPHGSTSGDHIEVPIANQLAQPHRLFNEDTDWVGYLLDSHCIAWMFKISMGTDVIMAILRFIPEVVWHASIRTIPLERVYDTLVQCFDRSSGHSIVIPKLKDKAYLAAKALLHLTIQRKCIGGDCDADVFKSISDRHLPVGSQTYEGDSDLTSTLGIIDCVLGGSQPMDWQHFSFTTTHHAWMGHILLYRAWDVLEHREPLPDDIKQFILHSFRSKPSPGPPIIADCWFTISLILEIPLHVDDLSTVDKRYVDVRYSFHSSMLTLVFKL